MSISIEIENKIVNILYQNISEPFDKTDFKKVCDEIGALFTKPDEPSNQSERMTAVQMICDELSRFEERYFTPHESGHVDASEMEISADYVPTLMEAYAAQEVKAETDDLQNRLEQAKEELVMLREELRERGNRG